MEEHICFWYDGNNHRLTRCIIDVATNRPIGFPDDVNASINMIVEYEQGQQPVFYNDDMQEMGVENQF